MNIFITFPENADLWIVKNQLKEVFEIEDKKLNSEEFNYILCYLPRKLVEDEGMNTNIVNFIDEIFEGRRLTNLLEEEECYTLEKCRQKIDSIRDRYYSELDIQSENVRFTDSYVDHMYILGTDLDPFIGSIINSATRGKIIIIQSKDKMSVK